MSETITTTVLEVKEFTERIKSVVINRIRNRLDEEIKPSIERIYQEEIAKYAIEIERWIAIDRNGTDLRITIHRPENQESPK